MLDKTAYISELAAQFTQIFQLSKAGKDNSTQRYRTQGFIQAGELMQLCSRDEVQHLMQSAHIAVFGCSVEQRQGSNASKARRQQALSDGNYEYFDEPAVSRQK